MRSGKKPLKFPNPEPFPEAWPRFCIVNQRPSRTALVHGLIRRVSGPGLVERWWAKFPNEEAVARYALRGNYSDCMMLVLNGRNHRIREVTETCWRVSLPNMPVLLRVLYGAPSSATMNESDTSFHFGHRGASNFRPTRDIDVAVALLDNGAKAIVTSVGPNGRPGQTTDIVQEVLFSTEEEAVATKSLLMDLLPPGSGR